MIKSSLNSPTCPVSFKGVKWFSIPRLTGISWLRKEGLGEELSNSALSLTLTVYRNALEAVPTSLSIFYHSSPGIFKLPQCWLQEQRCLISSEAKTSASQFSFNSQILMAVICTVHSVTGKPYSLCSPLRNGIILGWRERLNL